eukprot:2965735-Amphidinium_carterae.1
MSFGEVSLEGLSLVGDENAEKERMDSEWVICPFPEVPTTREKKSLSVNQLSGEDPEESPVVVLDSGEDSKDEDKFSVQAEASLAGAPATVMDDKEDEDHSAAQELGWHSPASTNREPEHGEKWFIEVCCEEDSLMSQQAEKNGWVAFRITQANPLQSVETQVLFASALKHLQQGGRVHVWFSLPCTAWSSWQRLNRTKPGDPSDIVGKENESLFLQSLFRDYSFQ